MLGELPSRFGGRGARFNFVQRLGGRPDMDVFWRVLDKVAEELDEVREAFDDPAAVGAEVGDLLFATVNLARHRGVDPEAALRQAAAKFRRRIQACEALAAERGIDTRTAGLPVLDALWDEVKATEPRR